MSSSDDESALIIDEDESALVIDDDNNYESVAAKRQKFDHIADGSIVKLTLKNFMNMTNITFTAHSKLNLLIGPNGSGKSSIVTALMLGFGGNPKDINRGNKISEFVKVGQKEADIFIELYKKSSKNICLRRTIFVFHENCHYYVDNVVVSKKKYIEVVEGLNIRVHNLCQFLPQDRLEDFSKLDSKGLLLNALQSIENQDLLNNFNKLTELADSMVKYNADQKTLQNTIKSEISTNAKLERVVNTFTEKRSIEKQLLVVIQKRCWSLYILAWKQIQNENKKFDDAKKHNQNALMIINKQRQMIDKKKAGDNNLKNVVLQNANNVFKLLEQLNEKVGKAECCISDIKELHTTIKNIAIKIEGYKESILAIEKNLESIKNETINVDGYKKEIVVIGDKIKMIDKDIFLIRDNLENIKSKLVGVTSKLYAIDLELDREKRKEEGKNLLLQRKYPELWKAINWLRNCDQKAYFRGQVFEPLFTQIEVLDQTNAKYIESIINYRDMIAFVFEYAEDLTKFNKIVKQEGWKKINSISAPPSNFQIKSTPNYEINSLKQFGFFAYALDMIKVPSVISKFLIKNYNMHNIPIGSNEVINYIHKLPNDIGIFFAGNDQVIIKSSMYTGEKITRQSQISSETQFLLFSVDLNVINLLNKKKYKVRAECEQLELQQTEIKNQLKSKENSRLPILDRKKEIQGHFIKFQNRQNAQDKMIKDIEFLKSRLENEKKNSTNFLDQNVQLIEKYFYSMKEILKLLDKYATSTKLLVASAFIFSNCCVDLREENKMLKQLKNLYVKNLNNFDEYYKYIQKLDSEFKKILEVALHWTKGVSPYDKNLFKPIKETFETIEQNDIDELDLIIVEKKAKLNCLHIDKNSPQLINDYKQRKQNIKDMEKKLENLNNNAQNKENQIETIYSKWFPKIQELAGSLSTNFQRFLNMFGCNGIIELEVGVTRYDFKAYGLLIKVQFRDDNPSMRLLDAKSQSGGERALTTALFLLALQEITHFPFRMVDEINQGMDKVYEKKLMELFMDLFEHRTNQYIVVTPKLIKDLSFKNTTVHILYSLEANK